MFEWSKEIVKKIADSGCLDENELHMTELALRMTDIYSSMLDEKIEVTDNMYELQYSLDKCSDKVNVKTSDDVLKIFGEYDKVVEEVLLRSSNGELSGSMEWCFYREDYQEITEEMEEVFNGENFASVTIDWNVSLGLTSHVVIDSCKDCICMTCSKTTCCLCDNCKNSGEFKIVRDCQLHNRIRG